MVSFWIGFIVGLVVGIGIITIIAVLTEEKHK